MLEPLIASRVRRTLLEHFLSHPGERFYLRGLAKVLNLSVSPTRRELLRLEQLGILKAYPEANIRFYVLDPSSPLVAQLTPHELSAPAQIGSTPEATEPAQEASSAHAPEWSVAATVHQPLRPAIPWLAVIGAVTVTVVMLGVGVASYLEMTNSRWIEAARDALRTPRTQVTVVEQPAAATGASASGVMRGSRWQVVPGGLGAFSGPSRAESY